MDAKQKQEMKDYEIVELLPEQIKTDIQYDVRLFSREVSTTAEDRHIELLAKSMEEIGQEDDVHITQDYVLFEGHRRRRAAILINERRSICAQGLFRLRCKIDSSGKDLHKKAIQSNTLRKNLSAMDLAYNIEWLRNHFGWTSQVHTKLVADYLCVDIATVTQHERLFKLEKKIQNQIHSGRISYMTALELLNVPEAQRTVVLERATVLQEEEDLDRKMRKFQQGRATVEQTHQAITSPKPPRIERNTVVKAIRERVATPTKEIPCTRAEIINAIRKLDAPGFSALLRDAARYFYNVYSLGQGTWDELATKFKTATEFTKSKAS
jgi:ParB-like chromosome segregation protein Spo0J